MGKSLPSEVFLASPVSVATICSRTTAGMRGASRRVAVRHDSAVGNKSPFDKNSTHEAGRGTPRGPRIHRCGGVLSGAE